MKHYFKSMLLVGAFAVLTLGATSAQAAVPTITRIAPNIITVGSPATRVVITGTNFVIGISILKAYGQPIERCLPNEIVGCFRVDSTTRITAYTTRPFLARIVEIPVTVFNPGLVGETSKASTLSIVAAAAVVAPVITTISPTTITLSRISELPPQPEPAQQNVRLVSISITGTGFVRNQSFVRYLRNCDRLERGREVTPENVRYVSPTSLSFDLSVLINDTATTTYCIRVFNSPTVFSNQIFFKIRGDSDPYINTITATPPQLIAGIGGPVQINGGNFNGRNPDEGPVVKLFNAPGLTPINLAITNAGLTLTSSRVGNNNNALTATVPTNLAGGRYAIRVDRTHPDGPQRADLMSNTVLINLNNPIPVINAPNAGLAVLISPLVGVAIPLPPPAGLIPSTVNAQTINLRANQRVIINGTGFVRGSSVEVGGVAVPTTFVPATNPPAPAPPTPAYLTITTPRTSVIITVVNPAPGGGTSNPATFTYTVPVSIEINDADSVSINKSLIVFTKQLKQGDLGENVRKIDEVLAKLGYLDPSLINDKFDTDTANAIKAFKANRGWPNKSSLVGYFVIEGLNKGLLASQPATPFVESNTTNPDETTPFESPALLKVPMGTLPPPPLPLFPPTPPITITSIIPESIVANAIGATVTVYGTGFDANSRIQYTSSDGRVMIIVGTVLNEDGTLTGDIWADFNRTGPLRIAVSRPNPNMIGVRLTSNSLTLKIIPLPPGLIQPIQIPKVPLMPTTLVPPPETTPTLESLILQIANLQAVLNDMTATPSQSTIITQDPLAPLTPDSTPILTPDTTFTPTTMNLNDKMNALASIVTKLQAILDSLSK